MATLTREQLKQKLKVEKGKNAELQKNLKALENQNKAFEEDASYQHDLYNENVVSTVRSFHSIGMS